MEIKNNIYKIILISAIACSCTEHENIQSESIPEILPFASLSPGMNVVARNNEGKLALQYTDGKAFLFSVTIEMDDNTFNIFSSEGEATTLIESRLSPVISTFIFDNNCFKTTLSSIASTKNHTTEPINYLLFDIMAKDGKKHDFHFTAEVDLKNKYNRNFSFYETDPERKYIPELIIGTKHNRQTSVNPINSSITISESHHETKSFSTVMSLGMDDKYILHYFGEKLLPAWKTTSNTTIADIAQKEIRHPNKIRRKAERFNKLASSKRSNRTAKANFMAAYTKSGQMVYVPFGIMGQFYPMPQIIADLCHSGEKELLKAMLNPIFEYSKSDSWKAPYAPSDVGSYYYVMHPMTDNTDKFLSTKSLLAITEKIDSISGNGKYSKAHAEIIKTWKNYVKQHEAEHEK